MATFQSNVDLSRLWDGSDEFCSTNISTCRTSWMFILPDEKYEAPAFREQSSATLRCWTTVHAKIIVALAFAPVDNLNDVFDALSNQLPNELTPILNWLEDNYISRPRRNNRRSRPAHFPPEIWSMYQRTISDIDKTNNPAEAAHWRLKRELDVVHPSVWKFIDGLHRANRGEMSHMSDTLVVNLDQWKDGNIY